jgi:hypothetical protein
VEPVAAPASAPASQPSPVPTPVPVQTKPVLAAASAAVRTPSASAPARRDAASKPAITTEKAGDFRPVPRSPVFAAPEPAASATAPLAQATPASAPAPEPRTAAEACGSRVLLARVWCIDRQCEKPQFRNDAECVKLREMRELRNSHRDAP